MFYLSVEPVGGHQVVVRDHAREHRLLGRREEHLDDRLGGQDDVHQPDSVHVGDDEQRQQPAGEEQVGHDHRELAVPAVHEHARDAAHDDLGDERRQQCRRRRDGRSGQCVDGVGEADTEDPVAGHGDESGGEEQPQVGTATQKAERSADVENWWHCDIVETSL
jgi:hypothetical protein